MFINSRSGLALTFIPSLLFSWEGLRGERKLLHPSGILHCDIPIFLLPAGPCSFPPYIICHYAIDLLIQLSPTIIRFPQVRKGYRVGQFLRLKELQMFYYRLMKEVSKLNLKDFEPALFTVPCSICDKSMIFTHKKATGGKRSNRGCAKR